MSQLTYEYYRGFDVYPRSGALMCCARLSEWSTAQVAAMPGSTPGVFWAGDSAGAHSQIDAVWLSLYPPATPPPSGVVPAYPSFSVDGQGEIRPAFGPYIVGQSLAILAVPASGWSFAGWTRNAVGQGSENPKTFQGLQANDCFKAVFSEDASTPIVWFKVTMIGSSGGSTVPPAGIHLRPQGSLVTIEAMPSLGYVFDHWELVSASPAWSGTDTRNPVTLFGGHLDRDLTVTPVFKLGAALPDLDYGAVGFGAVYGLLLALTMWASY